MKKLLLLQHISEVVKYVTESLVRRVVVIAQTGMHVY
jgi:hypothetical protein